MDVVATLKTALAGRYELEREIGAGGMATVYLARDVKHNRRVALKLLKPELGAVLGGERFLAEIQVTANLQHPNLLPLFDSGAVDGLLYYVMPYVDGETLRHRLEREKQLPVDEVLTIAVAVASALEYAHAHGVIHRDLKPENILMQAGQPVVADFGIALAVTNAGGQRVTQSGMSLGTPQYMSPEQATGDRAIDARADIYSLGAVVYEMLTGEPPHSAPTAQATIAKLLTEEARSVVALRRAVPDHMDGAVLRALEKLPADRFTSARSFADALQGKAHVTRPRSTVPVPTRNRTRVIGASVATGALVVIAIGTTWFAMIDPPQPTRNRLAFSGDAKYGPGQGIRLALSPNGSELAYVGSGAENPLYLKRFAELEPKAIDGAQGINLQFSPDGKWLAYIGGPGGRTLFKVQLTGGAPVTIADSALRFSWGDNDVVVFSRDPIGALPTLWRTHANGGPLELLATPDSSLRERAYTWPHVLPGGKAALFNIAHGGGPDSLVVAAIRFDDKSVIRTGISGLNPRYLSTGHLLFTLPNGKVMAAPFDARQLRVTGPPVAVLEGVSVRAGGASQYSVSATGTLVYVTEGPPSQLVMTDRSGRARILIPDTIRTYGMIRFSPDGKRLVLHRSGINGSNLWIYEIASGAFTQFTSNNRSFFPDWSADGRRLAWTDQGSGSSMWQRWDASEPAVVLLDSARGVNFSPTGRLLSAVGRSGRFMTTLDALHQRVPFNYAGTQGNRVSLTGFAISPDGKWAAYSAIPTGRTTVEIFVQAIPGPGGVHQVSMDGGIEPMWGATSRELFFRNRGQLWSASIATSPTFAVVRRDSMFAMNAPVSSGPTIFDVSPDGKSFVFAQFTGEENPPPVHVTNWFVELRARMAAAKAR